MKRFLSWIVLLLCMAAVALLLGLVVYIAELVSGLLSPIPVAGNLLANIAVGFVMLCSVFLSFSVFVIYTFRASDRVCESRTCLRYIFAGILMLLLLVLEIITGFRAADVPAAVYALMLTVMGFKMRKERMRA